MRKGEGEDSWCQKGTVANGEWLVLVSINTDLSDQGFVLLLGDTSENFGAKEINVRLVLPYLQNWHHIFYFSALKRSTPFQFVFCEDREGGLRVSGKRSVEFH